MPGYIEKALQHFHPILSKHKQDAPHAWTPPSYNQPVQYTAPLDDSAPLSLSGITHLQEIIGVLLYYAHAVDSTMLVALGTLASAQSQGTESTAQAATQLLNYCVNHPDAITCFQASDMILHVHSDASYLSETKACSCTGSYFYLSMAPVAPTIAPTAATPLPPHNGPILVHSSIMPTVLSSATEAKTGALFYNAKEATVLCTTLLELGYPQPPTPIQTDNLCTIGIINDMVHQHRSKAMDMHFYWVHDCVSHGDFHVFWHRGTDNLADYFTKHHLPTHHHLM